MTLQECIFAVSKKDPQFQACLRAGAKDEEKDRKRNRDYLKFPKIQTLSGKLSWSHYTEIIKANSDLEIGFYTKQCENEDWSVRELKRQMKSLLFHRIALSKDKKSVLEISKQVPTLSPQARGIARRTKKTAFGKVT